MEAYNFYHSNVQNFLAIPLHQRCSAENTAYLHELNGKHQHLTNFIGTKLAESSDLYKSTREFGKSCSMGLAITLGVSARYFSSITSMGTPLSAELTALVILVSALFLICFVVHPHAASRATEPLRHAYEVETRWFQENKDDVKQKLDSSKKSEREQKVTAALTLLLGYYDYLMDRNEELSRHF
ncbi:MAG: hypothetical protein JSR58_00155 [Verrucomicrobia bacterium]|nr:hypothetical protein [Verrucomicrobiota bacterium]